ncbi:MAG: PEP-CTERM sorting domain-containing protein [Burkholderiaceae bacterium]|nr:PEP-CTERM sorting domain-containing protein [Burkholderiaceae bacterium]
MNTLCRTLSAAALAAALGSAHASETYSLEIYSNDFNGSPDMTGWSSSELSTAPAENTTKTTQNGGSTIDQFLGEFGGTQSVRFALKDARLKDVATVTLTLDFLAIRSWDGNDPTWGGWTADNNRPEGGIAGGGSDRFKITVNDGTLLDKSFSNGAGSQTYTTDGTAPNGTNDFLMAGSRAQYALGYSFYDGINTATYNPQDSIYGMIFSFAAGDTDTLDLTFAGLGLQDTWIDNDYSCGEDGSSLCAAYRDESWGLDNISLTLNGLIRIPVTEVPAPGTLAALCLGLIGISLSGRRRHS